MPNELVKLMDMHGKPQDAASAVALLESVGGSLKAFLQPYVAEQHETVLACIEQWLSEQPDKQFQIRWNAAIKRNQIARLKLLQNRSLERLEELSKADTEGKTDWLAMSKEAAAHKMVLAGLLAGETHGAKQKQAELPDSSVSEAEAADAAEAEEAMNI